MSVAKEDNNLTNEAEMLENASKHSATHNDAEFDKELERRYGCLVSQTQAL